MKTKIYLFTIFCCALLQQGYAQVWSNAIYVDQLGSSTDINNNLIRWGDLETSQHSTVVLKHEGDISYPGYLLQVSHDQFTFENWVTVTDLDGKVVFSQTISGAGFTNPWQPGGGSSQLGFDDLKIIAITEVAPDKLVYTGSYKSGNSDPQMTIGILELRPGALVLSNTRTITPLNVRGYGSGTCIMQSPSDPSTVFVAGHKGEGSSYHCWVGSYDWTADVFKDLREFDDLRIIPYDMTFDLQAPDKAVVVIGRKWQTPNIQIPICEDEGYFLSRETVVFFRYVENLGIHTLNEMDARPLHGTGVPNFPYAPNLNTSFQWCIATDPNNEQYIFSGMGLWQREFIEPNYAIMPTVGILESNLNPSALFHLESEVYQEYDHAQLDSRGAGTSEFRLTFSSTENWTPRQFTNGKYAITTAVFSNHPATYGTPVSAKRMGDAKTSASDPRYHYSQISIATDYDNATYTVMGTLNKIVATNQTATGGWLHVFKQNMNNEIYGTCEDRDVLHFFSHCFTKIPGQGRYGKRFDCASHYEHGRAYVSGDVHSCQEGLLQSYRKAVAETEQEADQITALQLYPNPSHGIFTIELESSEPITYQVTTLTGKVLIATTQVSSPQFSIDLTDYSEGIYLLHLQRSQAVETIKLAKH